MKTLVITIVFLLLMGGAYLWVSQPVNTVKTLETALNPSPTFISEEMSDKEKELRAGGSSYRDPENRYVFLYPSDYKQDIQGEGQYIRITKVGATQRGQTELYDGVIVVFEPIDLAGQTLNQFVDNRIQQSTTDGTVEITEPKKSLTLNGYPAISYKARGLGESTYIYLQKDASSPFALSITTGVFDPERLYYQDEVDAIFATVELLK